MDVNLSHVVSYSRLGNGIAASSNVVAGDVVIRINDPYLVSYVLSRDIRTHVHLLDESLPAYS